MKNRKILYIQYTNPGAYPPLEHSSELLASSCWKVVFWGIHSTGRSDLIRFGALPRRHVYLLPYCSRGWLQKLHYFLYILIAIVIAAIWRPEWIYASDHFSCPAALIIKRIFGFKVLYHEHDSPYSTNEHSFFIKGILIGRRKLSQIVDICILPNVKRMELFLSETGTKSLTYCVWNCPSIEDTTQFHEKKMTGMLKIYYHGTIGPAMLPLALIKAIRLLKNVELCAVGYETIGSIGYKKHLEDAADKLGISDRIQIKKAVPRTELLRLASEYHVGISIVPKDTRDFNLQHLVGASNKVFDYMACGLALLVTNLPDWDELYVKKGFGLSCDPGNPESIAAALDWFLKHPDDMLLMGESGRKVIKKIWNYEHQFDPILKILETPFIARGQRDTEKY